MSGISRPKGLTDEEWEQELADWAETERFVEGAEAVKAHVDEQVKQDPGKCSMAGCLDFVE